MAQGGSEFEDFVSTKMNNHVLQKQEGIVLTRLDNLIFKQKKK
jgi:hypothetical protein